MAREWQQRVAKFVWARALGSRCRNCRTGVLVAPGREVISRQPADCAQQRDTKVEAILPARRLELGQTPDQDGQATS